MKAIEFEGQTCVYAKEQPEYIPLPVARKKGREGEVVSCWKLSWKERFKIFRSGKMWLSVWTFKKRLQPVRLSVNKEDLLEPELPKGEKQGD